MSDAAYDQIGGVLVSAAERMVRERQHLAIVLDEWKTRGRGRGRFQVYLAACVLPDEICNWCSDILPNGGRNSAIRFSTYDEARAAGLAHEADANARLTQEKAS